MSHHEDLTDIYVPGAWVCPACGFHLAQATIFAQSGEVGVTLDQVTRTDGECCPNDGTPMLRETWRERAESNRVWGESLMNEIVAATGAEHLPQAMERIKARTAIHYTLAEVAHVTAQRDSFRTAWETASRDSAEKGEAARRLADILSDFIKTGSASADLLRYVRLLDCGPNHCRYCSAKAPEWEHWPTCLFAASKEWTLRAGELRTRFRDLLQDDETAALVERWRTPKE